MVEARLTSFYNAIREKQSYQIVLLAVVIVFASALRFFRLGEWSLWIDEIFTINRVQIHFSDPVQLLKNLPQTLWLPISLILTSITINTLGVSEWTTRLASVLIGILTIPIVYAAIRRLFGFGVAIITAVLLAASPWHLFWSQNARFYTALLLLYTLAGFVFYLAIEKNRPSLFLVFYVIFYFAMSERLVAAFIFPAITLYLIILWAFRFERPAGLNMRNLVIIFTPVVLMLLFDLARFQFTGDSLISYFIADFAEQQVEDPLRLLISVIYNITFPIFGLGLVSGAYLVIKKDRAGLFVFISALLPVILLVLMNPFAFTKDRYVFVTLIFWLILAALAIKEIASHTQGLSRLLAAGILVMLLADAAGATAQYYLVNKGNRRDWRAAFQIVKENRQADDAVVAWWPEFSPFYLGGEIQPYKDVTVEQVQQSGKRYWFVIDSETVWGNLPLRDWVASHAQLIEVLYLRMPEDDFNLRVYLYDPLAQSGTR